MHLKFSLLALVPLLVHPADMLEGFDLTRRSLATRITGHATELSCILAAKRLSDESIIAQVVVPYHVAPNRFRQLYKSDGGIFALYNLLQLQAIQRTSRETRAARIHEFYSAYDNGINSFGEPLQIAFGSTDFDANKLSEMLNNLPDLRQDITFVDKPDVQLVLSNPFATADGNVLGRYHAQLQGRQNFAHGIIFHSPATDDGGFVAILACREMDKRCYFVTDATNSIPYDTGASNSLYQSPTLLSETSGERNPLLAFVQDHLEQPSPLYCFRGDPSSLIAEDLQRLRLETDPAAGPAPMEE